MTFEERVKLEAKAALLSLLEAKEEKPDEDGEDDGEDDGEEEEEGEEEDLVEESLLIGAVVVGSTVAGIGKMVNNFKKRTREKEIEKQIDKVLPNLSKDILRLRQRAKLLNSAQDIDSFEEATGKITNEVKAAISSVSKLELTDKELNSLSWKIQSPEKRLEKFRKEAVRVLEDTITDLQDLETIAMQELNAKIGI